MRRNVGLTYALIFLLTVSGVAQEPSGGYTAMGDSLATGYLAQAGYVPRYHTYAQTDAGLSLTLYQLGQNGATSGNLLDALRTNSVFASAIAASAVVTWNVGLNNFRNARQQYKNKGCKGRDNQDCLRAAVALFKAQWDSIVYEIVMRAPSGAVVRTMTIYNPWVAADKKANTFADSKETGVAYGNDLQVLSYYLRQMNEHIEASAGASGVATAIVHAAFNGTNGDQDPIALGYIAGDGIHPSEQGHEVLARALRDLGYSAPQ
jgi:lysophospholipase L1-like esterase